MANKRPLHGWHQYHMSEMNGVSNLLATWVRFTLSRKRIYTSNGNTNGLLGKAVCKGLTFLKFAFLYLLSGHFIGIGPKRLQTMLLNTGVTVIDAAETLRLTGCVFVRVRLSELRARDLSHLHLSHML